MIHVGNNIKVLLTKFNNNVKIDDIGGELLLYDHTHLCSFEDSEALRVLKNYSFTGVSFQPLPDFITFNVHDLYEQPLEYVICNRYFFVKKVEGHDLNDPLCVVGFKSKIKHWLGDTFFGHFIEMKN